MATRITDITSNKKLTASIGCPVRAATGLKVDREKWAAGNVKKRKEQLSCDCKKRDSRLTDRCDLVCPDLLKVGPLTLTLLRGLVFALIDPGLARGGARTREGLFLRHDAWIRPILRHFPRALVARRFRVAGRFDACTSRYAGRPGYGARLLGRYLEARS
jgi:hypothetical protein